MESESPLKKIVVSIGLSLAAIGTGFALAWMLTHPGLAFAFTNYDRDPSGSPAESPVTITINNNGDCGGYGGYDHSFWLDLLDDGANHWYYQHQYNGADVDVQDDIICGATVCNSISTDSCSGTDTLSCDRNFTQYGVKCGDGGGAGATTADAWTLTTASTSTPPEEPTATTTAETAEYYNTLILAVSMLVFFGAFALGIWLQLIKKDKIK